MQVYQGLINHPRVTLTVLPIDASRADLAAFDWVLLLTPTTVANVNLSWISAGLARQTLVVDFSDMRKCSSRRSWYDIPPYRCLVYFKRAFVTRKRCVAEQRWPCCSRGNTKRFASMLQDTYSPCGH